MIGKETVFMYISCLNMEGGYYCALQTWRFVAIFLCLNLCWRMMRARYHFESRNIHTILLFDFWSQKSREETSKICLLGLISRLGKNEQRAPSLSFSLLSSWVLCLLMILLLLLLFNKRVRLELKSLHGFQQQQQ